MSAVLPRGTYSRGGRSVMTGLAETLAPPTAPSSPTVGAHAGDGAARLVAWRRMPALVGVVTAAVYATTSLLRYASGLAGVDLAIFAQAASRYAGGHMPWSDIKATWGFNLLGDHFSPVIALLGPLYALVPHSWVLLIAQAALIGVAAGVLAWAAARKLGSRLALVVTIVYAAAWGTQGLAMFDFHEVAFALPLLAAVFSCLLSGRDGLAVLWALPLMLVKEDSAFLLAGIVLVLLWRRRWWLAGMLAAYAAATFALIVGIVIPAFSYYGRYTYWSASAASDGNVLTSSVRNILESVTSGAAPLLLLVLFAPTAGIALRSPFLLAILPSLAARLTSPNPNYWGLDLQYNATIVLIIVFAFLDGLARAGHPRGRWRNAVAALAITAVLLPYGPTARVLPGTLSPCPTESTCASQVIGSLLDQIPDGARVAASDIAAAYLVDRTNVHGLHDNLFDSAGNQIYPDYVVINKLNPTKWEDAWMRRMIDDPYGDYEFLGEAVDLVSPHQYDIVVWRGRHP